MEPEKIKPWDSKPLKPIALSTNHDDDMMMTRRLGWWQF
jgi:hypothetical protein